MKKIFYIAGAVLYISMSSSCKKFLDTETFEQVPTENAYKTAADVQNGLTGAYNALGSSQFMGMTLVALGDIAADNASASPSTGHFVNFFAYNVNETTAELSSVWSYGYKIQDRTTRNVQAGKRLLTDASVYPVDKAKIKLYMAQSYALRALSSLSLVNVFGLPYKAGTANPQLGIVLLKDAPIAEGQNVTRSSVGDTYTQILADITAAKKSYAEYITDYQTATGGTAPIPNQFFFNPAAVSALEARVKLYMQDWDGAIAAANDAIAKRASGNVSNESYVKMWSSIAITDEDIFTISKTADDNLSANSLNTLYSTYKAALTNSILSVFATSDIRKGLINGTHPAKFDGIPTSGDVSNVPMFRKSEMYLILAEANAQKTNITDAQTALLYTAKRNTAIATVADLPADQATLLTFIADERRRELFEEGHRWYDARRTQSTLVRTLKGTPYNWEVFKFVYPIPADEINAGYMTQQNDGWAAGLPKR